MQSAEIGGQARSATMEKYAGENGQRQCSCAVSKVSVGALTGARWPAPKALEKRCIWLCYNRRWQERDCRSAQCNLV